MAGPHGARPPAPSHERHMHAPHTRCATIESEGLEIVEMPLRRFPPGLAGQVAGLAVMTDL